MNQKVRLTKLKDTEFNGDHPNGFNVDHVEVGFLLYPVEENLSIRVENGGSIFSTSYVTAIVAHKGGKPHLVRTKNSVYQIDYID